MSEQDSPLQQGEPDKIKWIGLGFLAGLVISVLTLEYYGYLKHPSETDSARIEEFVLLSLEPGYEVKVSPKSSGKQAFCLDGYLLVRPQNGKEVAGILVDGKNRPLSCEQNFIPSSPAAETE